VGQLANANIAELSPAGVIAATVAAILFGLLYCFAGYRLFRFLLGLTGFILAGSAAAALAGWLSDGRLVYMAAGLVLGGVAGAAALYFMYYAGVFCLGLLGAVVVAHNALAGQPESWVPWALLGAGVLGGLLALWLMRPVIVLATAAIGASLVVHGAVFLAGTAGLHEVLENPAHEGEILSAMLIGWAALTLLGAVTQFLTFQPKPEP